ncbi:hypothetical protein M0638_21805 [Roseomonas sp. NAR14]|uniref:Uncharacterized protein n=1 Tax=Roseomonas acroporae TaxID=2937791 RepID=A0A9X1YDF2_9PROT|nr:hypothetical protein [Roseomonas acroporae]
MLMCRKVEGAAAKRAGQSTPGRGACRCACGSPARRGVPPGAASATKMPLRARLSSSPSSTSCW